MNERRNNFGLSRKTNVAIAAIGGLSVVKDALVAIIAIVVITLVTLTYQFLIDRRE